MMNLMLTVTHPIEGLFFGAGKAGVVVGVAAMILIGLLLWIWSAHRKLNALEQRIEEVAQTPAQETAPITPHRS